MPFSRKTKDSPQNSRSPQDEQQLQAIYPWSAHTPPFGRLPSRYGHTLSTSVTPPGELFLFGGSGKSLRNDLYVISTRDFTTTPLKTSGDVPNPRYGHCAVLTSTSLLIWGGITKIVKNAPNGSLYLLNLVSRQWTSVDLNAGANGPMRRYHHTMTLVDSKLFVFGGESVEGEKYFNDIWALDLHYLKSNPFWESYGPAPGKKKPPPRSGHVSVATRGRIIIFGGMTYVDYFNDTWSFDISTRQWTALRCTGSIPSPRTYHAAVLLGDVMYDFGGYSAGGVRLGDLIALNVSTQRWFAFQGMGPSPSPRYHHAMAYDGTRVFVLGGTLSQGTQAGETKLIHVLDTKHPDYPTPDSDVINTASPPTRAVVANIERDQRIGRLTDELAQKSALLARAAEENKRAGLELRKLQAKLDKSLLSRDSAREQAQSALHKASRATEANEQSQRELTEIRAELEASRSELTAFRLRLADMENGRAKSKAEADTYRNQNETGFVNTDEDRVVQRLMERIRGMEAKMASLPGNEKSFEMMECRNED